MTSLKYIIFKEFHYTLRVVKRSVVVIPAMKERYQWPDFSVIP
jgi:hypothetical protein